MIVVGVVPLGQADRVRVMGQTSSVNPTSEHALYLQLFVTNGGGW
jgi:hypothetical protein